MLAESEKRKIALCIGNANYPESSLKNPCNDANDVATSLQLLGFVVQKLTDASTVEMDDALRRFSDDLSKAQIGLFFFAGHGMQIEGTNFLTAVNSNFETELDAKHSSLPLEKVLEVFEKASNSTSIVLLDACRDNPYERQWRGTGTPGLASIYAPRGTIIAYATSSGQTASDGTGRNGAFTAALLQHISTQNVSIEDLFKRVRNTLSASTLGKQTSWEHTSLMGDFFFNPISLTGEMKTSYSREAMADREFTCHGGRPLSGVLDDLRSHNWYRQNLAISQLTLVDLTNCSFNELFVLGRNLYQAACGDSYSAKEYLNSLRRNLNSCTVETTFHILNGMLYEIYFGPDGTFRNRMKGKGLEDVFFIEEDPQFEASFRFCREVLQPYREQMFYFPLDLRDVVFDAVIEPESEKCFRLRKLFFGGDNVLFMGNGEPLSPDTGKWITPSREVGQLEDKLSTDLGIPKRRLRVIYSNDIEVDDTILAPYEFAIIRSGGSRE